MQLIQSTIHHNHFLFDFLIWTCSYPFGTNALSRLMIDCSQTHRFVGKMIRGPPDCPSRNMITACCDHKRRVGRPQTTRKNFLVENLRLLFQDIPTIQINQHGSLCSWIHEASNEKYWCQLTCRPTIASCHTCTGMTSRLGASAILAGTPRYQWTPTKWRHFRQR